VKSKKRGQGDREMGRVGDNEIATLRSQQRIATLPSEACNDTLFCLANVVLSCQ